MYIWVTQNKSKTEKATIETIYVLSIYRMNFCSPKILLEKYSIVFNKTVM